MEKKRKISLMLFLFLPGILSLGPPEILPADILYEVQINESVCMPCKVQKQSSNPMKKVLFYWSKQNSPIGNWPRYRIKENRCLRIRNVIPSDQGEYVCHAMNTHGKTSVIRRLFVVGAGNSKNVTNRPTSREVTPSIRKNVQPSFPVPSFLIDHLKVKEAVIEKALTIGQREKLKCAVEGAPTPVITWYKDGVLVTDSGEFRKKVLVLVIRNFQENHVGKYTCIAENSAGKVNMSFIITVAHNANFFQPPLPVTENLYVRRGMNLSLTCHTPANKVKLMQWHVPKLVPRVPVEHPSKDVSRLPFAQPVIEKPNVINSSRFKTFRLYNISKWTHQGKYRCVVLYKNSRKPFDVKIVNLIFQPDDFNVKPKKSGSGDQSTLILFIGIPVFAGVLSMVLAVICIRCYRYHKKRVFRDVTIADTTKTPLPDDDDALSMQILPSHFPTNSLRSTHKSFQNISEQPNITRMNSHYTQGENAPLIEDPLLNSDVKKPLNRTDEGYMDSINRCNLSQRSLNNTNRFTDNKSVKEPSTNATKQENWPGEKLKPGDIDYIDFQEDEILIRTDSNTTKKSSSDSLSEHRNARKTRKVNSSLDSVDTHNSYTPNNCSHERPPPISNLHEDEDYILQQEIKNWQPLIRNSARLKENNQRKIVA